MSFISFSQNYEDVILWRALRQVERGFYIDVGAADPNEDSVTRSFYERGWHGINIEPEPGFADALRDKRSRDINLEVAVGREHGHLDMYMFPGTGLSTFDCNMASQHAAAGFSSATLRRVEMMTLAEICDAHAAHEIHFLKIDVEGAERDVLAGADFRKYRPWIVLVEATVPHHQVKTMGNFEDLLLSVDYRFRLFDGLNAFYIAGEHDDALRESFELPPNVFDDFVSHKFVEQLGRADQAEAARDFYHGKLRDVTEIAEAMAAEATRLRGELDGIQAALAARDILLRDAADDRAILERHLVDLGRMNRELARGLKT